MRDSVDSRMGAIPFGLLGVVPVTLKRFICLLCDGTKGDGTVRRIRPAKLYACNSCVKEHNGVDYIYQNLDQFITEFKARNAPRETRISFQSLGAAHPDIVEIKP